ncbi:MAG: type IVB secretion system apparatus protein IcmL/DotI [Rhodospirillaceae bacterium]|nr:type IVB secretion system apparatus protein IcmL/DotI [Rhodospirillaceae bacterium]
MGIVTADAAKGGEAMDAESGGLAAALRNRWALSAAVRAMAIACAAMALVSALSVAVALWALSSRPEPRYFATRTSGELVQLVPLGEPHLADSQVVNFAVDAITRAFSIDFANYRRELSDINPFFTEAGYRAFLAELDRSGTLDLIRGRRMTSAAVANGGVVVAKGLAGSGRYVWRIEIPLTVTYQSASERQVQKTTYLAEVERVPTWTTDWGVAVSRIVGQQRR